MAALALHGVSAIALLGAAQVITPHGDLSGSAHQRSSADATVEQVPGTDRAAAQPAAEPMPPPLVAEDEAPASDRKASTATPQVATDVVRTAAPEQIVAEGRTAAPGQQLVRGDRSTSPGAPLSDRDQGRPQAVARLGDDDRCDPQADTGERTDACDHTIETRAADFTRPDPAALTPEQRLLIERRLREEEGSPMSAARRIARNEIDPADADAQGVASLVLTDPREQPETAAPVEQELLGQRALEIISALTPVPTQ